MRVIELNKAIQILRLRYFLLKFRLITKTLISIVVGKELSVEALCLRTFRLQTSTIKYPLFIQLDTTLLFCFIQSSQSFSISPPPFNAYFASIVVGGAGRVVWRQLNSCTGLIFAYSFTWSRLSFVILHTNSRHTSSSKLSGV